MPEPGTSPLVMVEPAGPEPGRPARAAWVSVTVAAVVGPFLLWAVARVLGLDARSPFVQLMAFTPYVAAASVAPLLAALWLRRWWLAGVAAVGCLALLFSVVPRAVPGPAPTDGVVLRVLSLNLYAGSAPASAVVDLVRTYEVDVLALQEFTPRARIRLAEAGLDDLLPYAEAHPYPDVDGSAVYSRYPLTDGDVKINPGAGFRQASAVVNVTGARPVVVESVHPISPSSPDAVGYWAQGLREQSPAGSGGPRMLIGDFNATLDHVELRRLLATGYTDVAAERGQGLVPTWPYHAREYRFVPKVAIDHALITADIAAVDFRATTVPRTDHRAILATVLLPAQ